MLTMSQLPIYKIDYFIHQIPSSQMSFCWRRRTQFDTLRHFALMSHCATFSDDGNFIQMLYMVETRLPSNINNLELHETGNACWVLHSNHLTDSNDSRIFLQKTRESKMQKSTVFTESYCLYVIKPCQICYGFMKTTLFWPLHFSAFTKATDTFNKNKRCYMTLEGLSSVCATLELAS